MKLFSPWGDSVKIVLSDKSDGNMRSIGDDEAEVLQNQTKMAEFAKLGIDGVARILSDYDRDDFVRYFNLNSAGGFAIRQGEGGVVNDGLLTSSSEMGVFLPIADCLAVVLFDSQNNALMMVHSGRHNLEQDGLSDAVKFMVDQIETDPANIKAWLSPSAGQENYPLHQLDNKSLQQVATEQLIASGVLDENIIKSEIDTTTDQNYFSHSMGDTISRFAVLAVLE